MNSLSRILSVLVFLTIYSGASAQFYNGSNLEFGKNRVQYRDFDWYYLPTENFEVYYYQGGQKLGEYVVRSCENNLQSIQNFFDFTMEDKIQVMAYLKQSEFRQSNVGLSNDDQYNIGGVARIMGNKMFVYYEDSHARLDRQVRENLARVVFMQMMYGGDWKDVLKSSTMLSMPEWYSEGVINYAANGFDSESENYNRDLVLSGKFKSFNRLSGKEATLAGTAFWHYVSEVYGQNVIPNILYMTRLSRNVDSGFLFVLGLSLNTITIDFAEYFKERYRGSELESLPGYTPNPLLWQTSQSGTELRKAHKAWKKQQRLLGGLELKQKKKYTYTQFVSSPDMRHIAFVTNELGQYKIWIYDTQNHKLKRVLKREYKLDRLVDYSFPLLAWHPSGRILTYTFEQRGRAFIGNYNLEDKKRSEKELMRIQKVVSMNYSPDGRKMIFSGVREGQTDLYLYQVIGNNPEQLTFDVWDDLNPSFIREGTAVIFASNRPDDTLRTTPVTELLDARKDLFVFDLDNRKQVLERITQTPLADEDRPFAFDSRHYMCLSNENGIYNRAMVSIDSTISAIDTSIHYRYFTVTKLLSDYSRDAGQFNFYAPDKQYSVLFKKDNRYLYYTGSSADDAVMMNTPGPGVTNSRLSSGPGKESKMTRQTNIPFKGEIDINNYRFEDEKKDYTYEKETIRLQEVKANADTSAKKFVMPKPRGYRLNFATDYILTQVDNNFTQQFYQNFSGPTSTLPGISGLVKMGVSDLMEDYKIVGGFRLALNLQNNEYGIIFENIKNRWDKKITLMRQGQNVVAGYNLYKVQTHSAQYQLKYPFNELASLRATLIYRNDRVVTLSTDPISLAQSNYQENNTGVRLEYVFDNTRNRGLNLHNGTRYKVWAEHYRQPDVWSRATDFQVAGFDFRHYKKIHRDFIAAFRLAGATSFGFYKMVHYLGGVDNWLFQRINTDMPVATNQNYWYQALASPMRGFYVNSRNGNTFAVANAELRFPVFRYLMRKPIRNDFLENFQVITFTDAGSAWTGWNPYSDENALNQQTLTKNPVTVTISNNREPVIYGYGFGIRSRVLGYFMRADWAWGVDDGRLQSRVFYLSLNLDF